MDVDTKHENKKKTAETLHSSQQLQDISHQNVKSDTQAVPYTLHRSLLLATIIHSRTH